MSTTGHEVPKKNPVDTYNDEATQVYLRALRGWEGDHRRYESQTNIVDLMNRTKNDN